MDEQDLIRKTLEGKEGAFEMLVKLNQTAIYKHCLSITHDEGIAQDLTQETFLQAFKYLSNFRMDCSFSTWLWRIAHNISLNYIKRHRSLDVEFKEELFKASGGKDEAADDDGLNAQILKVIEELPEKQRVVVEMYIVQRIPQKQIAAQLNIPVGTVRSRLYYARRVLRKFLPKA